MADQFKGYVLESGDTPTVVPSFIGQILKLTKSDATIMHYIAQSTVDASGWVFLGSKGDKGDKGDTPSTDDVQGIIDSLPSADPSHFFKKYSQGNFEHQQTERLTGPFAFDFLDEDAVTRVAVDNDFYYVIPFLSTNIPPLLPIIPLLIAPEGLLSISVLGVGSNLDIEVSQACVFNAGLENEYVEEIPFRAKLSNNDDESFPLSAFTFKNSTSVENTPLTSSKWRLEYRIRFIETSGQTRLENYPTSTTKLQLSFLSSAVSFDQKNYIVGGVGGHGWTPAYGAAMSVDNSIVAIQLQDYVGGDLPKPLDNIGQYLAIGGYTTDINQAVNIKAIDGTNGRDGFTPVFIKERRASDNGIVEKLARYVDVNGVTVDNDALPFVGQYTASDGGYTTSISEAANFKGLDGQNSEFSPDSYYTKDETNTEIADSLLSEVFNFIPTNTSFIATLEQGTFRYKFLDLNILGSLLPSGVIDSALTYNLEFTLLYTIQEVTAPPELIDFEIVAGNVAIPVNTTQDVELNEFLVFKAALTYAQVLALENDKTRLRVQYLNRSVQQSMTVSIGKLKITEQGSLFPTLSDYVEGEVSGAVAPVARKVELLDVVVTSLNQNKFTALEKEKLSHQGLVDVAVDTPINFYVRQAAALSTDLSDYALTNLFETIDANKIYVALRFDVQANLTFLSSSINETIPLLRSLVDSNIDVSGVTYFIYQVTLPEGFPVGGQVNIVSHTVHRDLDANVKIGDNSNNLEQALSLLENLNSKVEAFLPILNLMSLETADTVGLVPTTLGASIPWKLDQEKRSVVADRFSVQYSINKLILGGTFQYRRPSGTSTILQLGSKPIILEDASSLYVLNKVDATPASTTVRDTPLANNEGATQFDISPNSVLGVIIIDPNTPLTHRVSLTLDGHTDFNEMIIEQSANQDVYFEFHRLDARGERVSFGFYRATRGTDTPTGGGSNLLFLSYEITAEQELLPLYRLGGATLHTSVTYEKTISTPAMPERTVPFYLRQGAHLNVAHDAFFAMLVIQGKIYIYAVLSATLTFIKNTNYTLADVAGNITGLIEDGVIANYKGGTAPNDVATIAQLISMFPTVRDPQFGLEVTANKQERTLKIGARVFVVGSDGIEFEIQPK